MKNTHGTKSTLPTGPLVCLVYRVDDLHRLKLFEFLSKAIPYYERDGGLSIGIFESLDEPGLLFELVAYTDNVSFAADQLKVENDPEMKAVLKEWHAHFDSDLEVSRLAPVNLRQLSAGQGDGGTELSVQTKASDTAHADWDSLSKDSHGLTFAPALFADYPSIKELLTQAELPVPDTSDKPVQFLVARKERAVIACIGWESYGFRVLLRSLAVEGTCRGQGIGLSIVNEALSRLKKQGYAEAYLLTVDATGFASSAGFSEFNSGQLPESMQTAGQIASGCCKQATCMFKDLRLKPTFCQQLKTLK